MDIWGREHTILGFAKPYGQCEVSKTIVYASTGFWFSAKTGESQGSGHHLVSLCRKSDEVRYWLANLKQIRSVNHADNLRLVKDGMDRMRSRVNKLIGRNFLSANYELAA